MRLVNLTPHSVAFYSPAAPDVVTNQEMPLLILPSMGHARCAERRKLVGSLHLDVVSLPVFSTRLGPAAGLPDSQTDTVHLVSRQTYTATGGRADLVIVDQTVRAPDGHVVGCRSLARPRTEGGEAEVVTR